MEQYEAMLATATQDYRTARAELEAMREDPEVPRRVVRSTEDTTSRLRAVVETLTVYTTGQGMHLQWDADDL